MSTKPTVTTDLRNNYLLALNALNAQLNTTGYTTLDPVAFTEKYQISENALLVLGNMGFLNVQVGSSIPAFKRTSGLLNVKPDHLIKWVARYNSENNVVETQKTVATPIEKETDDVKVLTEAVRESSVAKPDSCQATTCSKGDCFLCKVDKHNASVAERQVVEGPQQLIQMVESNPSTEPQQLITPFNVSIQTKGLSLSMEVFTTEDQDIVNLVLDKLSRVK